MMRKENMWKAVVAGALVITMAATGITLYNTGEQEEPDTELQEKSQLVEGETDEELKDGEPFESQDVSNNTAIAEGYEEKTDEEPLKTTEVTSDEEEYVDDSTGTSSAVLPALNFTEDSVMVWPVSGEVLIDYSMETTTYFSTLDQYKCNNGIVLGAEVGTAVQAAVNGKILSIVDNEETGLTVTMDIGNGYQAIYGQLKELKVKAGETIAQGEILGYVENPTKYFVKEGSNLYFAVKKDGEYIDPMIYLETVTE